MINTFNENKALILTLLSIFLFIMVLSMRRVIDVDFSLIDYIWNYGLAEKIPLNYIPYRDFSALQTPLSFYITALFLDIFGNGYHAYAIMGFSFLHQYIICSIRLLSS